MNQKKMDRNYKIAYRMIRFMHDNRRLRKRIQADVLLEGLGLRKGDVVFEPGCGPGFYTEGAAVAVGPEGHVHAYDVNPYLTDYLNRKIEKNGLIQVSVRNQNASESGLDDDSADFSFITGIPHAVGGFESLIKEIYRVLKKGGILAYQKHRGESGIDMENMKEWGFESAGENGAFSLWKKK